MKTKLAAFAAGIVFVLAGLPAFAHHPFTSDFDWKKPVTLMGTITDVAWVAPHVNVYLGVDDGSGNNVIEWVVELGSPRELMMFGWTASLLKPGGEITVDGWLATDGRRFASAKSIMLPNGLELFAASSFFYLPGDASFFPASEEGPQ